MDFSSVHNIHERAVLEAVNAATARYPGIGSNDDLLADVACVALNRVQPRYIRHAVDLAFFLTESERQAHERAVNDAVDYAFGFVQARHLMAARRQVRGRARVYGRPVRPISAPPARTQTHRP